jgi:hypothetical protein
MARAPSAVHRNRVIYQSEALFVSPDSTGYHFTGKNGYGLMTPPLHGNQEAGEVVDNKLYGWTPKDGLAKWPDWNGDDSANPSDAVVGSVGDTQNSPTRLDFGLNTPDGDVVSFKTTNNEDVLNTKTFKVDTYTTMGQLEDILNNGRIGTIINSIDASSFGIAFDVNNGPIGNAPGSHTSDAAMTNFFNGQTIEVTFSANATTESATISAFDGVTGTITLAEPLAGGAPQNQDVINIRYFSADDLAVSGLIVLDDTVPLAPGTKATITGAIFTLAGGPSPQYSFETILNENRIGNLTTPATVGGAAEYTIAAWAASEGLVITSGGDGSELIGPGDQVAFDGGVGGSGSEDSLVDPDASLVAQNGELEFLGGSDDVPSYDAPAIAHGSIIKQLKRVQTLNYGFSINRTDVNQFGHLARLDSIVLENPTVNMDFTYFLLDGYNERMLEFVTNGQENCLSGHLNPEYYQAGNNFFVVTVPESRDVVVGDASLQKEGFDTKKSVISVGNGFVTDYSVDVGVGAIPTASITVEGMNIKSDIGTTGLNLPSVDLYDGSLISDAFEYDSENGSVVSAKNNSCTGLFSLPAAQSGFDGCPDPNLPLDQQQNKVSALRPGDIVLNLSEKGLLSVQSSGDYKDATAQKGSAHVQTANLSVGMSRTNLQRLGSTFSFSKAIDVPINATLSVSAVMSDLKQGNMVDLICNCEELDIEMDLYEPECVGCTTKNKRPAMRYSIRGAQLQSESFSSTIGDNKTVDLEFTVQIGGADDLKKGVFISGREGNPIVSDPDIDGGRTGGATAWGLPPGFTGAAGEYNVPQKSTSLNRGLRSDDREASTEIAGTYDVLGYRA